MSLPKITPTASMPTSAARGDDRGPFGYGRPAHGSDPDATYMFAPPDGLPHGAAGENVHAMPLHDSTRVSGSADEFVERNGGR